MSEPAVGRASSSDLIADTNRRMPKPMKNPMAGEILQTQVGDVLKIIKKSDCTQTIYNIIFPFIDFLFFLICLHGAAV